MVKRIGFFAIKPIVQAFTGNQTFADGVLIIIMKQAVLPSSRYIL